MTEELLPVYALEAQRITYSYPSEEDPVPVFSNLDLQIPRGSFTAILGPNGCGKSTLARHFNGLLVPTLGRVLVFGTDTSDPDRTLEVRRAAGMVFQNPDNQIVANVVEEDVAFAPENLGIPSAQIRIRVDEALAAVGMTEYRTHAPHLLSGGQKQRVAIAGVIAMHPSCILLDEPTAMLDPQGRKDVMDTILRLNREESITIVLITHHMSEAALADRIVVMDKGAILTSGTPGEVFSRVELLREAGLEVPDTTALCWELNRTLGTHLPLDALSVEDCARALAGVFGPGQKN